MEDKLLQFYKFIIRRIVGTVDYNPEQDEYIFNRISISDDILKEITEEGRRYGLTADECVQVVNRVSSDISPKPYAGISKGQFDSRSIALGQHFEIHFEHPHTGYGKIELVCSENHRFIVLGSSISGLNILDELEAVTLVWNPGFFIDFAVFRKGKRYPDKKTKLAIGKYAYLLIYEPSAVYEIIDSDKDFAKKEKAVKQTVKTADGQKKKAYVWTPNRMRPISFAFDEADCGDRTAPFVITYSADSATAAISLNEDFVFSGNDAKKEYLLYVLSDCCSSINKMNTDDVLKGIRTLKDGVLQRDLKEKSVQQWILVSKPQIEYILDEEEKIRRYLLRRTSGTDRCIYSERPSAL